MKTLHTNKVSKRPEIMHRGFCKIALGVSISVLTACSAHVDIKSVKADSYQRMPKRIFFVADLAAGFPGEMAESLGETIEASLRNCGVESSFNLPGELKIDNPIAQKMKYFSPDSLVSIKWTQQNGTQYGVNGVSYRLEMVDIPTKSVVWKAEMGLTIGRDEVTIFSTTLFDRLKRDHIIPANCSVNKVY